MSERAGDAVRFLVIGSSVVAAVLLVVLGVPRVRGLMTPRIERVYVVSAALGDRVASTAPRDALQGTPVTLFALIEATPFAAAEPVLYGRVDSVLLDPEGAPVPVQAWSDWWYEPEFLWFKVEPELPFANESFDPEFRPEALRFVDNYQVSWGFGWSHALDVRASGDSYPDWRTGTMRFAARAVIRDERERILQRGTSPGAESVHASAIAESPHRVSVRAGDDAFGWMLAFGGLPYVPVSDLTWSVHPTTRLLGGTVLDFWLYARHAAGEGAATYLPWESLSSATRVVVDEMFLAREGTYYWTNDPLRPVTWDTVRAGDLLVIEDHVGVLYEDRGPGGGGDGVLNRWDRALEAYFEPLRETLLGDAFVSGISVYRLQDAAAGSGGADAAGADDASR